MTTWPPPILNPPSRSPYSWTSPSGYMFATKGVARRGLTIGFDPNSRWTRALYSLLISFSLPYDGLHTSLTMKRISKLFVLYFLARTQDFYFCKGQNVVFQAPSHPLTSLPISPTRVNLVELIPFPMEVWTTRDAEGRAPQSPQLWNVIDSGLVVDSP